MHVSNKNYKTPNKTQEGLTIHESRRPAKSDSFSLNNNINIKRNKMMTTLTKIKEEPMRRDPSTKVIPRALIKFRQKFDAKSSARVKVESSQGLFS